DVCSSDLTHLRVLDLVENLSHDGLKGHGDEVHPVRGAVALPEKQRHFLYRELMLAAAEIEEEEVRAHAALHGEEAGYSGVEAAGDQGEHRILRPEWEPANAILWFSTYI